MRHSRATLPVDGGLHLFAVDLSCEICVRLWASYGVMARELRGAVEPKTREVLKADLDAALQSIRRHELEAHQRPPEESEAASA